MTDEEFKTMHLICSGLAGEWKSILGLYTQYAGYLTAEMAKSLLILKMESWIELDDLEKIDLDTLNDKAREYGTLELSFPRLDREEANKVLLALWECLDRYDLPAMSDQAWEEMIAYLDGLIAKADGYEKTKLPF